jgi:hypothetical protein
MNEHEKFAEELIERGLERAGEVEPLAGLEERLLGKLSKERERRVRWWWMGAPVAAMLLIVALIYWRPQPGKPAIKVEQRPPKVETPAPTAAPPLIATTPQTQKSAARGQRLSEPVVATGTSPRQEVFPAPAALSDEERVLVALARRKPEIAAEVAQKQAARVQNLEIAPIKIEPLVAPETNGIE